MNANNTNETKNSSIFSITAYFSFFSGLFHRHSDSFDLNPEQVNVQARQSLPPQVRNNLPTGFTPTEDKDEHEWVVLPDCSY